MSDEELSEVISGHLGIDPADITDELLLEVARGEL
jgi:hypothetical protein